MFWQFNKVHVSHTCQLSRIIWESPGYSTDLLLSCLPPGHHICQIKSSPKLFCALVWDLAYFFLKTWSFLICSTVSGAFLHVFSHSQRLFLATKWWLRILIVCTSCKTSYDNRMQSVVILRALELSALKVSLSWLVFWLTCVPVLFLFYFFFFLLYLDFSSVFLF